jgi:hypothetical protein
MPLVLLPVELVRMSAHTRMLCVLRTGAGAGAGAVVLTMIGCGACCCCCGKNCMPYGNCGIICQHPCSETRTHVGVCAYLWHWWLVGRQCLRLLCVLRLLLLLLLHHRLLLVLLLCVHRRSSRRR